VNTAPFFVKEVPKDFTMKFNTTYTLYVPQFADNEGHAVSVTLESVPAGQVDFAEVFGNEYIEFTPDAWSKFKDYDLVIILSDGNMQSQPYNFKLSMTNSAPTF
jgi:hypothetical protein